MKCPRCHTTLESGSYEEQPAMLCPSCNGIMIKQRDLPKVLSRLSTDLEEIIDIHSRIEVIPDKGSIHNCPECYGVTEYYGYMESKIVKIDYCPSCNWLWIDTSELQAIAKMYVQFQDIKADSRLKYTYELNDIVGIHMTTEAVAKAFLMGFVFSI